jgi:hypothetical protein
MGVKDGDHLIVTTEMKLPFDYISEEEEPIPITEEQENMINQNAAADDQFDNSLPVKK